MARIKMFFTCMFFVFSHKDIAKAMTIPKVLPEALEYAILFDQAEIIRRLILENNVNINQNNGEIIFKAIAWGRVKIIEAILENQDIDFTLKSARGLTLLEFANEYLSKAKNQELSFNDVCMREKILELIKAAIVHATKFKTQ